ncbi:ADP-ribosyl-[dinitrogen reductase] glycohydrolase [Marinomonas aquimarina]|uniref:ADP-ribosyl-[dinitrogen reductase] glycohydrolase n=1 Tax=Marinomonas aquimarina TaxID=295068 RepID=A0A1A8TKF9_9GAMM|nr:ADP-ribosylglycohydrolase family protein [Marinomonas aquimarina]SBS33435.1 ADP-ribosyl-[dinitrogen reductase] glycohydrolase [Marinomonas aquimarina]
MQQVFMEDRVVGALVGLACGDALGTTLEFKVPGSFSPITDMTGGGPFRLAKGEWTDDTSMALCLGFSLLERNGFDAQDQMSRYLRWQQEGYLSSNGSCFDIGMTVSNALMNYEETLDPFSGQEDESYSGNGSIMRLAPVAMYYAHDLPSCIKLAGESSRTTHGSPLCIDACKLLAELLVRAFQAESKSEIFADLSKRPYREEFAPLLDKSFSALAYDQIKGSGFVVESLIAALWCFYQGKNYREAVLLAANLGDDADTTAAICGQIAGAFYGLAGIPEDWHRAIAMDFEIKHLARQLYRQGVQRMTVSATP